MRLISDDAGVKTSMQYDELTDQLTVTTEQDLSSFLDNMKARRNDENYWKRGVKEEFAHYCSIPPVVIMQMKAKGIDVFNPGHMKDVLREINQNYPYLKATDKRHA